MAARFPWTRIPLRKVDDPSRTGTLIPHLGLGWLTGQISRLPRQSFFPRWLTRERRASASIMTRRNAFRVRQLGGVASVGRVLRGGGPPMNVTSRQQEIFEASVESCWFAHHRRPRAASRVPLALPLGSGGK